MVTSPAPFLNCSHFLHHQKPRALLQPCLMGADSHHPSLEALPNESINLPLWQLTINDTPSLRYHVIIIDEGVICFFRTVYWFRLQVISKTFSLYSTKLTIYHIKHFLDLHIVQNNQKSVWIHHHTKQNDKSDLIFFFLFLRKMFKILKERCSGNAIVREATDHAFLQPIIREGLLREAGLESSFW